MAETSIIDFQNPANGMKVNSDGSINIKAVSEQDESSGAIALTSPPTNTNAGSDTPLTFSQKVNRFLIQNNTTANCYVELDATATLGSIVLLPNASWTDLIQVTVIHVYTVAAQPVNAASGIDVRGWL